MSTPNRRADAAQAFYAPLADAPSAARRVGWEDDDAHRLRLAALAQALAPLDARASVVDAGCGEGALLPLLRRGGFVGSYRGEDLLPHMIAHAAARHDADPAASFAATDAFDPAAPPADAVVCSGALNTRVDDGEHDAEVALALAALWERTRAVLVVDLAVADRHPPGAGLARADLAQAWTHARRLAPVVTVREDVVPGEALLVLARSRAEAFAARLDRPEDRLARARLLLAASEPDAALALVAHDLAPESRLVAGRAEVLRGALGPAEAILRRLAETSVAAEANLTLAGVLWRTGRRRAAETLLRTLAATGDEARAHLAELLIARGDRAEALAVAAAVTDPWVRREIERLAAER